MDVGLAVGNASGVEVGVAVGNVCGVEVGVVVGFAVVVIGLAVVVVGLGLWVVVGFKISVKVNKYLLENIFLQVMKAKKVNFQVM